MMKNNNVEYKPLSYELFQQLPERIQSEMINEVISGIAFIRGGTLYTPETFRKDLTINRDEKFCFDYKVDTVGIHGLLLLFTFGHYYNDSYKITEVEGWEGLDAFLVSEKVY